MSEDLTAAAPASVSTPEVTPVVTPKVITSPAPEVKADGQTAEADAKAPAVVPEHYDLKPPEGYEGEFKADVLEGIIKPLGLDNEKAQMLVNSLFKLGNENAQLQEKASQDAWKSVQEGYINEIKADEKLGGQNFERTQSRLNLVREKVGNIDPDSVGIGNIPSVVRVLDAVGALLEQDSFVNSHAPVPTKDAGPRMMYPNSPELK